MNKHFAQSFGKYFGSWVMVCALSACGGSSGTADNPVVAGARSSDSEQAQSPDVADTLDPSIQQDEVLSCDATIDTAEFLFTEIDRQWTCEISADAASSYTDLYFSRDGTAVFGDNDIWYWHRKLPGDAIGLASPTRVSKLITDLRSSNTQMSFTTTSETGQSESYECLLIPREVSS